MENKREFDKLYVIRQGKEGGRKTVEGRSGGKTYLVV
jgi:hypothetical protein